LRLADLPIRGTRFVSEGSERHSEGISAEKCEKILDDEPHENFLPPPIDFPASGLAHPVSPRCCKNGKFNYLGEGWRKSSVKENKWSMWRPSGVTFMKQVK